MLVKRALGRIFQEINRGIKGYFWGIMIWGRNGRTQSSMEGLEGGHNTSNINYESFIQGNNQKIKGVTYTANN